MRLENLCLAVLRKSLGDIESILSKSPSAILSTTPLKQTVLHLAADWPIGMTTLVSRGGKSLVHALDLARQSPLDHACFNDCASIVKFLLQADSPITPELMDHLEERSNWKLLQILVEELSRRRDLLRQLAEAELSENIYRDLEIPVKHPMSDIKTVVVLSELERYSVQMPESLAYYGIDEIATYRPANFFGSSFGNTSKGADVVHNAGFLLDTHVDLSQKHQLRGRIGRFFKCDSPCNRSIAQHLDKMLWLREKGLSFSEDEVHHTFRPSKSALSLQDTRDDLIYSSEERIDLLSQLLSSRSGIQHTCPCCIDACYTILAALKSKRRVLYREIKDPSERVFIFSGLLGLLEACKNRLDPEFWTWAMPRLIYSVLYEVCCLTHSRSCCKRDWWVIEEDEVKEKQEEEEYIRCRLSTLTEELTAEYEESSLLLSDFLRDRVVVRALELIDGEEKASPEDRKRLREIGVILEEESESECDETANDDRL